MKKNIRSDRPRPLEDRIAEAEPGHEEQTWPTPGQFVIALIVGAMLGTTIANVAGCL